MLADIVKIHCLTHRANFPMPRTSRIVVCKEGAEEHVLSNDFPYSGWWIYCCNCQTFIAWKTEGADFSVKECPFCLSSLNPRLYACDHCAVTMLDFDDQTLRKHHTVLSWGMPQPACPGCHQFPSATPKTHFCAALQCNLATARVNCPFCNVNLESVVTHGVNSFTFGLDAALAEAEARAREAEERRFLAEEAARKEIELRVQAERTVQEIEKKVAREIVQSQAAIAAPEFLRFETELAQAKAVAENKAHEEEELRLQAEAAARIEAERRVMAEQKARDIVEMYTGNTSSGAAATKDKVSIALLAAIATFLFLALVMLITTMIRYYYS